MIMKELWGKKKKKNFNIVTNGSQEFTPAGCPAIVLYFLFY